MQRTYDQNEFHTFLMNYISLYIMDGPQTDDEKWNNFISELKKNTIGTYLFPILDHDNIRFDAKLFINGVSSKDKTTLIV